MNKLFGFLLFAAALITTGCQAVTAQCLGDTDCSTTADTPSCAQVVGGDNPGSWCTARPSKCVGDFVTTCTTLLKGVCNERNGGAYCDPANGIPMGCDTQTCTTGYACIQIGAQGGCVKTCVDDTGCSSDTYCGYPLTNSTVKVCLPDLPNGQSCDRAAMCTSGNCPVVLGQSGNVCTAQPTVACSDDSQCTPTNTKFCDISAGVCKDRLDPGMSCTRTTANPQHICKADQCNADKRCACGPTAPCSAGFICSTSFECIVDPGMATQPWVEVCGDIGNVSSTATGAKIVVFHNGNTATYYSESAYTPKNSRACLTLTFGDVCGTKSITLNSATNGPGPATATNTQSGSAGSVQSGIELQINDMNLPLTDPATSNSYAGIERDPTNGTFRLANMLKNVTVRGLGNNAPLGTKSVNLQTITYRQSVKTGTEGNGGFTPAMNGCSY